MKPENILMDDAHLQADGGQSPREDEAVRAGRFRLVDFGNAMLLENTPLYHDNFEVQSLCYRAPEVLLGTDFGHPIDMWSFGCIIVEVLTGETLFEGKNRRQLLAKMHKLLGPLPKAHYATARYFPVYNDETPRYFTSCRNDERFLEGEYGSITLSDLRHNNLKDLLCVKDPHLIDFIDRCLFYDPAQRLTPTEALRHPFIARAARGRWFKGL